MHVQCIFLWKMVIPTLFFVHHTSNAHRHFNTFTQNIQMHQNEKRHIFDLCRMINAPYPIHVQTYNAISLKSLEKKGIEFLEEKLNWTFYSISIRIKCKSIIQFYSISNDAESQNHQKNTNESLRSAIQVISLQVISFVCEYENKLCVADISKNFHTFEWAIIIHCWQLWNERELFWESCILLSAGLVYSNKVQNHNTE